MNLFGKKPKQPEVVKAPAHKPEPPICSAPCINCNMVGCCLSCDQADSICLDKSAVKASSSAQEISKAKIDVYSFWCNHDFQPTVFGNDLSRPMHASRRKAKIGQPCFVDGKPCQFWRTKYLMNIVTGEKFAIPSR